MKTAPDLWSETSTEDVVTHIAWILECAYEHSSDSDAWGKRIQQQRNGGELRRKAEFYYAYSHASYICACILAQHIDDGVEAETFTDILWDTPFNRVREEVEKIVKQFTT
jgi:hypothetical protein